MDKKHRFVSLEELSVSEEVKEELWQIAQPKKKRLVSLDALSEDDQHKIMKVVLKDQIEIVRQGLRGRESRLR